MNILKINFMLLLFLNAFSSADNRTAQDIGRAVAAKIIRETAFELCDTPLKPVKSIQVLDYSGLFTSKEKYFFSVSNIFADKDTSLMFRISYAGSLCIYINDIAVYSGKLSGPAKFKEIAYGMLSFQDTVKIDVNEGKNSIYVELEKNNNPPVIYLREIPKQVNGSLTARFGLDDFGYKNASNQWLTMEPLLYSKVRQDILSGNETFDMHAEKLHPLQEKTIKKYFIPKSNTYKRESYLEWHYANGTVLMGLLSLAQALEVPAYQEHVERVINFTVKNYDLFQYQYDSLHAFRTSNYRMFRKTMLDDTGAPALPYLQFYLDTLDPKIRFIVDEMGEYVFQEQVRLKDGTFCRPEPVEMTVWADDLFMSVPYLVRMGKLTRDKNYYDDAARQVINFKKYLFNENIGLYKHGWFQESNKTSIAYWSRANGWVVWAHTEALLHIPKDHEDYEILVSIFKKHIQGLLKYQSETGMWHQILDNPDSFKETSSTAMFILGILRGVKNGWIPEQYKENALLAWNELKTRIDEDGTVKDICRGTGIGFDYDFYLNRQRFDNDPRGLGAVLTAISEIISIN